MALDKNDESILTNIDRLVKEEEHLYGKSEITHEDRARLSELKVHLDQCWDLLRQRRALREFGKLSASEQPPAAPDDREV